MRSAWSTARATASRPSSSTGSARRSSIASYAVGADALARYLAKLLGAAARGAHPIEAPTPSGDGDAAITQPIEIMHDHHELDAGRTIPIVIAPPIAPPFAPIGTLGATGIPEAVEPLAPAQLAAVIGAAHNVVLRPARRRRGPPLPQRVLCGTSPATVTVHEDGRTLAVDLEGGHKTGAYLDLRGLRRALVETPLANARVLNLFAYTGMLGRSAELAGARSITQVDQSARALAFAAQHHTGDAAKHEFIVADVFDWLPALPDADQFELVIVDPPAMTSKQAQVPGVLAAYRKLYRAAARHVHPGGAVIAACCTSRIDRAAFKRTVREALGPGFVLERDLPPEPDHPVGFPQADYLKIGMRGARR